MAPFLTEKMQVIRPLLPDATRPFWSVMIPTYKPRADYLEETLKSVLQQDPGPGQMQIEVVDDGSPNGAPVELVRRLADDRVSVHREPANNGLAGIWNRCIERARGEWVHILHQDDVVLPGFYDHLYRGIGCNPQVAMAFCRFAISDANGHWKGRPQACWMVGWNAWRQTAAFNVRQWWLGGRLMSNLAVSERIWSLSSISRCGLGLPQISPSFTSRKFWPSSGAMGLISLYWKSGRAQTCKTWRAQSKSGKIIFQHIAGNSWNSRA